MVEPEILKYGIADAKFNTFGGTGNSRPEGQLAFFRNERPNCLITWNPLSMPVGRDLALAIEKGFVAAYMASNVLPYFQPPAYQFRPIPDIGFKLTP